MRVHNPELRASVLAALRLKISVSHVKAGRLYTFHHDGHVKTIIAQGDIDLDDEAEADLARRSYQAREPQVDSGVVAFPLGRERQVYTSKSS